MVSTELSREEADVGQRFSQRVAALMCSRLSQLEDVTIPASMYSQLQRPSTAQIEEHLLKLLQRDAPVFLERHGRLLLDQELQQFQTLRSDYEINHYLTLIERQRAASASSLQGRADAQTKNRRLAYMQQLLEGGEYFSMEAMRDRAPLLYQQYVGQHEEQGGRRPVGGSFLSDVLQEKDEVEWRSRLAAEQQAFDMQESEEEEEEEMAGQQLQGGGERPGLGRAAGAEAGTAAAEEEAGEAATRGATAAGGGQMDQDTPGVAVAARQRDAVRGSGPAVPVGALSSVPMQVEQQQAGLGPQHWAAAAGAPGTPDVLEHQHQPADAAGPSSILAAAAAQQVVAGASGSSSAQADRHSTPVSMEDRVQLEQEFVSTMKERFLMGHDGAHVDYTAIDGNAELDDHWLQQRARDEEEQYFDDV